MQKAFDRGFEQVRHIYLALLRTLIRRRIIFIPAFLLVCVCAAALLPWLGRDFFPASDSGQFMLHFRAQTGTRIEDTAMLADQIENTIRRQIPKQEVQGIVDNIGLPYSQMNFMYSTSGVIGASDADVLVSLNAKHHPTADYVRTLRTILPRQFPGTTFYFLPADMVTQILNFGLPAPVDLQIEGQDQASNHELATRVLGELRHVPGLTDLRIQQPARLPDVQHQCRSN